VYNAEILTLMPRDLYDNVTYVVDHCDSKVSPMAESNGPNAWFLKPRGLIWTSEDVLNRKKRGWVHRAQ
jgi:hypothetical protein